MHAPRPHPVLLLALLLLPLAGCGDDPVGFNRSRLTLSPSTVEMGTERSTTLTLINNGTETVGNISIVPEPVRSGSAQVATITMEVEPTLVESLEPGASVPISVTLSVIPGTPQGIYRTELSLRVEDRQVSEADLTLEVDEIREMTFLPDSGDFGTQRELEVVLKNTGSVPLDEVNVFLSDVRRKDDGGFTPWETSLSPTSTPRLQPGDSVIFQIRLDRGETRFDPAAYQFSITALSPSGLQRRTRATFRVVQPDTIEVNAPESMVQGEAFPFQMVPRNASGQVNDEVILYVSTSPEDGGHLDQDLGLGVGYRPGETQLRVRAGELVEAHPLAVEPRQVTGSLTHLGEARVCTERVFGEVGLYGGHAYVGSLRVQDDPFALLDVGILIFDVSNPSQPELADSLLLDARAVSDVDILVDRGVGIFSLSAGDGQEGGLILADLSSPREPKILTRFSESLEDGVLTTDVAGDILYVSDHSGDLNIVDVSDPTAPRLAAILGGAGSSAPAWEDHGLLFLREDSRTMTIFDVGGAGAGGTSETPVEIGGISLPETTRFLTAAGAYDPVLERAYLTTLEFGGEEFRNLTEVRTYDLTDPSSPVLVAWAPVGTQDNVVFTPGDLILDQDRDLLHVPWGDQGFVVLDVSGDPFADVFRGGREVARSRYNGSAGGCGGTPTLVGNARVDQGTVYVSDANSGLVILQGSF